MTKKAKKAASKKIAVKSAGSKKKGLPSVKSKSSAKMQTKALKKELPKKKRAESIVEKSKDRIQRAPIKKIVGKESTKGLLQFVDKDALSKASLKSKASPLVSKDDMEPALETKKTGISPQRKVAWDKLPKYFPPHICFLINAAKQECAAAQGWPFPFGKFIADLPNEICGLGFAYLIMSLSNKMPEISRLCGVTAKEIEDSVEQAIMVLDDKLSSCSTELHRKIRALRGDLQSAVEAIVSPNQITGVDRNFQLMLAHILLRSINPKILGCD